MPKRYALPPEMEEAIYCEELHLTPDQLENYPESTLNNQLLYKAIKNVTENGGNLQF